MMRPILCPSCKSEIRRNKVGGNKGGPFPCPSCGKLLRISPLYFWITPQVALLICVGLGYLFGLNYFGLFVFAAVLWFPATAFLFAILHGTFNPKVEEDSPGYLDLGQRP